MVNNVYHDLIEAKKNGLFEDDCTFSDKSSFGHLSGQGKLSNPEDPIIYLDPWKDSFTIGNN